MVSGRLVAGTSSGTSLGTRSAWASLLEAGRELSRELPNTSGDACSIDAPALAAAECKRALCARPTSAALPVPWMARYWGRHSGGTCQSVSGPPSLQYRGLHAGSSCKLDVPPNPAVEAPQHSGSHTATGGPLELDDLSKLAEQWRHVSLAAGPQSNSACSGNSSSSNSARLGGSSSSNAKAGIGHEPAPAGHIPPQLLEQTLTLLDQRHSAAARRIHRASADSPWPRNGPAAAADAAASANPGEAPALADIITSAASLFATSRPPPDLARSLVAAAAAGAHSAPWPQAAQILHGLVRMGTVGTRYLDWTLARIQHIQLADPRTGSDGIPSRRAGPRAQLRAANPPPQDASLPGPSAADSVSLLRSLSAVHAAQGAAGRNAPVALLRLMRHLQALLPALPGPAPLVPLLHDVTSCGWRHDREPEFLLHIGNYLSLPCQTGPPAPGDAPNGSGGAAVGAAAPPRPSTADVADDGTHVHPPQLLTLTPAQLVSVLDSFARAGVHHSGLMERALDGVDRCLPAFTPSQAARVAEVCARFTHYRPALMRRLALHVGAHLPAAVAPGDVAGVVAALARCRVREERFLDVVAAYAGEHAGTLLEAAAASEREAESQLPQLGGSVGDSSTGGGSGTGCVPGEAGLKSCSAGDGESGLEGLARLAPDPPPGQELPQSDQGRSRCPMGDVGRPTIPDAFLSPVPVPPPGEAIRVSQGLEGAGAASLAPKPQAPVLEVTATEAGGDISLASTDVATAAAAQVLRPPAAWGPTVQPAQQAGSCSPPQQRSLEPTSTLLGGRTGLFIDRLSPTLEPYRLLNELLAVPGVAIDMYYMPYDYAAVSTGAPGRGCAFVSVTSPGGAAALMQRLRAGPVCGMKQLATAEHTPAPNTDALLRTLLNLRHPHVAYVPRTGTCSRPVLLYVSGSLRGQVQPLDPADVLLHEWPRHVKQHHATPQTCSEPRVEKHPRPGPKPHLAEAVVFQQQQPPQRRHPDGPCASHLPQQRPHPRPQGADWSDLSATSPHPQPHPQVQLGSSPSSPPHQPGYARGSPGPSSPAPPQPRPLRSQLLHPGELGLLAHSMAALSYHHSGFLDVLGRLMQRLTAAVRRDPRLVADMLPQPTARGPPQGVYDIDSNSSSRSSNGSSSSSTRGSTSTGNNSSNRNSSNSSCSNSSTGLAAASDGGRHCLLQPPALKSVLHALHALASQPSPDAAACRDLGDVCASALLAWLPPEAASKRSSETSAPGAPAGLPTSAVTSRAADRDLDVPDGEVAAGSSSHPPAAAAAPADRDPDPTRLLHSLSLPSVPLPPSDVLDVHVKLVAQALTVAADHGRLLYHPRMCGAAAALLRHHLPRLRPRAACALLQPLVRFRHPSARQLVRAVAPLLTQQPERLSPASLVNLAWACARTGQHDNRRVVGALAERTGQLLPQLPTSDAAQLFWALAVLRHDGGGCGGRGGDGVYEGLLLLLLDRYDLAARDLLLLQEGLEISRRLRAPSSASASVSASSSWAGGGASQAMDAFLQELLDRAGHPVSERMDVAGLLFEASATPAEAQTVSGAGGEDGANAVVESRCRGELADGAEPGAEVGDGGLVAAAEAAEREYSLEEELMGAEPAAPSGQQGGPPAAPSASPPDCSCMAAVAVVATAAYSTGVASEVKKRPEAFSDPRRSYGNREAGEDAAAVAIRGLLQQIMIARQGLALEEADGFLMRLQVPDAVKTRARSVFAAAAAPRV